MTPVSAINFVAKQIKPRVYGGKLDEALESDWVRCLKNSWIQEDLAKQAVQDMVDNGTALRVSAFYKAYKRIGGGKVADQGKPVCLFGILPEKDVDRYNDPTEQLLIKNCLIKWFYTNHPKYIPHPQKMAEQARYWAEQVKGRIIYAPEFAPKEP